MTESEFNDRVDALLERIEDAIDEGEAEIDFETSGGILTLSFEDGSRIIINRQTPLRQVWVATRGGGFHYDFDAANDCWVEENGAEELFAALSRFCSEQAGETVALQA